ncbi:hypothetical protein LOTGIDRAFT_110935 [Lottia gigantea]|uniref:Proteasome inhibitor PI31 subunit n=1 Tax=Lottia gigantea TaxID=225164 RepID=V4AG59_LOTGI|nr:hypothetical protein LOTGIDRAFT_110935 [Lottia gigantea]ESP03029.1 hypothetical protein LOTGIDRAFT_110935 [Lottia gigantea]
MPLPGLELLFQSVTNVLRNSDDALVPVIHWKIISNGFKCVGKGEQANGQKSEVLPAGWNNVENGYVLRYIQMETNKYFLLKVMKVDEALMVNFTREVDEKTANTTFKTSDYSTGNLQDYHGAFTNLEEFVRKLKWEILDEFLPTQKIPERQERFVPRSSLLEEDPLRLGGHGGPSRSSTSGYQQPEWMDPEGPFSVGHGDLDPLGRMGGGMLMDPRRSGPSFGMDPSSGLPARLPRGAIPPGARFDPFGPPGARPSPDPDHMRPPDYDDMFM